MKTPEPELFRSGRQFAAWIGLTPRDHGLAVTYTNFHNIVHPIEFTFGVRDQNGLGATARLLLLMLNRKSENGRKSENEWHETPIGIRGQS